MTHRLCCPSAAQTTLLVRRAAEVQHLRLQAYAPRSGFAGSFAPDFFFPVGLVMLAMAG